MKIAILSGGVGGAKLLLGASLAFEGAEITAIVNTGDDFRHLGLHVSPDVDTALYTLSGKANRAQGWGREGESWAFMTAVRSLGGEDWFNLGDGDLALHVLRSARLAGGEPLSAIIADFAQRWGIGPRVLPMSDDTVATIVETDEGVLEFQRYFVARRCDPRALAIRFEGAAAARPAPGTVEAIAAADVILIAPSNPLLSIDPILAVPGLRAALQAAGAPRIAVSPLIGGQAVKGPTAKLMAELGLPVNNQAIADHYAGLIDGLLVDEADARDALPIASHAVPTLMTDDASKAAVARAAVAFASRIDRR